METIMNKCFIFIISLKFTLRHLSYTVSSAWERYYISCDTWAQCFICRPLNIDLTSLDPHSHQPPHIAQAYQLNWLPKPTVILRVVFLRFLLFFLWFVWTFVEVIFISVIVVLVQNTFMIFVSETQHFASLLNILIVSQVLSV